MIDGRTRHELHRRLGQVLGRDEAATLMAHLPPIGWADVATKEYVDLRFELFEERMRAEWRGELAAQTRTLVLAMLAANATLGGLAFAAARLA